MTGGRIKVGLLLLGDRPRQLVHAASQLWHILESESRTGGGLDVRVLTDARSLDGHALPGTPATIRRVASGTGDDPGDRNADDGPGGRAPRYLSLTGKAALDCDVWVLLDADTGLPLSMARPTVLWSPRLPDRMGLASASAQFEDWVPALQTMFHNRLGAAHLVVHDSIAETDARHYAQVPEHRIIRLPLPAPRPLAVRRPDPRPRRSPYILWHLPGTDPTQPGLVLNTLKRYYDSLFGQCGVVIHDAAPSPVEAPLRARLTATPSLPQGALQLGGRTGSEDLFAWACHAEAVIVGCDWLRALPVIEACRLTGAPAILSGRVPQLALTAAQLPDARPLGPGSAQTAAQLLKEAEVAAASRGLLPAGEPAVADEPDEPVWTTMLKALVRTTRRRPAAISSTIAESNSP